MIRRFLVFLMAMMLTVGSISSSVVALAMEVETGVVNEATQTQLSENISVSSEAVVTQELAEEVIFESKDEKEKNEKELEVESIVEEMPMNSIVATSTNSTSYKSQFDKNGHEKV